MKKQQKKQLEQEISEEEEQEYQQCECCKRKQIIDQSNKKFKLNQNMMNLLEQTNKKLPTNINLDCVVTPNGMKLIFEQKILKNSQKLDMEFNQKKQMIDSFSSQILENPEILNEIFPYLEQIYQVDLDCQIIKDGKNFIENQWLLQELDQKNCFREEYLPVMKYIDLEKFETGIFKDQNSKVPEQIQMENSENQQEKESRNKDQAQDEIKKLHLEQEQRIKEYLKIHYNETKIIKRIIVPGDQVEQYFSKSSKDWFKENVIKLLKDKDDNGSIQIQEKTIISTNQKELSQPQSEILQQIDSTGSTNAETQNCEIQEIFSESSQFIMAMNERKNMAQDQSMGDMKCFQQNLTMMAFLKPNTIKCSTVISSQNFTVKTSISCYDSPKKSRKKDQKFNKDCNILDALPVGYGQLENFIRRRDCDGNFKENLLEIELPQKQQLTQQMKKKGQNTQIKFILSIMDGGCGDIRSFRELKIFNSQRNKFNYNQIQSNKLILPILLPQCQVSIKDDNSSDNQMYFVLQYLNRMKIGEVSCIFIPQSLHTYLLCRQFGKCSLKFGQEVEGLNCFCKRNIVLYINLFQKKDIFADCRDQINIQLSRILNRGYDILLFNDITKKSKCKEFLLVDQVYQINHQLKLMEIDLQNLKKIDDEQKITKYKIQAQIDLHISRILNFHLQQIQEKIFYAQQNNFKCFSLHDCRKLVILEHYAIQLLLVKKTALQLMYEMIPTNDHQNYLSTFEYQKNYQIIDNNFAIYILTQISLAQNLQESAKLYSGLLQNCDKFEMQGKEISENVSQIHYRKCEAFSINIEKEKCKNICFLLNNNKNIQQLKDMKIPTSQPKIDRQFWNETDKKLKWLGLEEIIQENQSTIEKKNEKNKQNNQICVIKQILQYGDDPDSQKTQTELKQLKKIIKQQLIGIKLTLQILTNTEWIQRKKIDNFDGIKIQPIKLINEEYQEIKITSQNKNYWYLMLRGMSLGEISEFWVNSNCEQNEELLNFVMEICSTFLDQWCPDNRQSPVIEILKRNPLQIIFHKLKIKNQPCNIFNISLATSSLLHHQAHKNFADQIFEEYQMQLQKNEQTFFQDFDKCNPLLQKCLKIYSQQYKQIQTNLQQYSQLNEKQKEQIQVIFVDTLVKISQIYLGLQMWSKSISFSNKAIEIEMKNYQAIFIRSIALIGKIESKIKLKNDCKNYKCHICYKQAKCAKNSLIFIIKQFFLDLGKFTEELKQIQMKMMQNLKKIDSDTLKEINQKQTQIDIINKLVTDAIKAMQHSIKIIQKTQSSVSQKSLNDLYKISQIQEGQLLQKHSFFKQIDGKLIQIKFDEQIKVMNQREIELEKKIKFEEEFENALMKVCDKNRSHQYKLYSQEQIEKIVKKINQKNIEELQLIKESNQQLEYNNQIQNYQNNQENMELLFKFNRASTNNQNIQQPSKDVPAQPVTISKPQQQTSKSKSQINTTKIVTPTANSNISTSNQQLQNSELKTKNQKKKQKKKEKLLKDQQVQNLNVKEQESEDSDSSCSNIDEIQHSDINLKKSQAPQLTTQNNSCQQRNGKSVVVNNENNDDFFKSFQKVSKHAQQIKKQTNFIKTEEKQKKEKVQGSKDQFIVLQNNYNGPNVAIEANSSLKDYMAQKAQRKLTKLETKFIQYKVSQWQDYEKNDKQGHLGYNRMQLSQINAISIVDKCIEFQFDERKYQDWISNIKVWDEFVAKNIPKREKVKLRNNIEEELMKQDDNQNTQQGVNGIKITKCRKCRADKMKENQLYDNAEEENDNNENDEEFFDNHDPCCPNFKNSNGMWNFHQTDGQKHQVRIKKLNAVKRNEVFEEKYEETREEREIRLQEADRKREIINKMKGQGNYQHNEQNSKNYYYQFGQAQNLLSLSTSESEKVKNSKIKKEDLISTENQLREQQIRQQRQLLIINGGKDPQQLKALKELLEKAELEKTGICDESQKKIIEKKIAQKIHQQNINKYVYSSDEYISESECESENQESNQNNVQEDRSTKSLQQPANHNSIFAFTPYYHYDSNSSQQDSVGIKKNLNQKSGGKDNLQIKSMQDLESHWKQNQKAVEKQKEEIKECINENDNSSKQEVKEKEPSDSNKTQKLKSEISIKSLSSSKGTSQQAQIQQAIIPPNFKPPNYKTVLCKWFEQYGKCQYEGCTFAHGQKELVFNRRQNFQFNQEKEQNPEKIDEQKVKSEELNEYDEEEVIEEGNENEVNYEYDSNGRHYLYKTQMCKNMQTHGLCSYGNCSFAHSKEELRKLPNFGIYDSQSKYYY